MNIKRTTEITTTGDRDEADQLVRDGWNLLGVFQVAEESGGRFQQWPCFVLGKSERADDPDAIVEVREVREDDANIMLSDGWLHLRTLTRKGQDDEYPCFVLGRTNRVEPERKRRGFVGNGVH